MFIFSKNEIYPMKLSESIFSSICQTLSYPHYQICCSLKNKVQLRKHKIHKHSTKQNLFFKFCGLWKNIITFLGQNKNWLSKCNIDYKFSIKWHNFQLKTAKYTFVQTTFQGQAYYNQGREKTEKRIPKKTTLQRKGSTKSKKGIHQKQPFFCPL